MTASPGEWCKEQRRLQREIDWHQQAEESYIDGGEQIRELARNAQRLFARQESRQKPPTQLRAFKLLLGGWRGALPF